MSTDHGATFSVRVHGEGDDVVVAVAGEVDLNTAPALRASLLDAVKRAGEQVIVDMFEVTYFDSSGVHGVFDAAEQARRAAKGLRLVRVRPHLMRLLAMTGVPELIPCEPAPEVSPE